MFLNRAWMSQVAERYIENTDIDPKDDGLFGEEDTDLLAVFARQLAAYYDQIIDTEEEDGGHLQLATLMFSAGFEMGFMYRDDIAEQDTTPSGHILVSNEDYSRMVRLLLSIAEAKESD